MTNDAKKKKAANSAFYRLTDRTDKHVRVPPGIGLGVFLVGHAKDLHGPRGCCKCCPRSAS